MSEQVNPTEMTEEQKAVMEEFNNSPMYQDIVKISSMLSEVQYGTFDIIYDLHKRVEKLESECSCQNSESK